MTTSELNNFVVILIYGSLVLLSLLQLTNPLKVNKKANVWLGIFLFLWSTFWINEVLSLVKGTEVEVHQFFFVQFIQFLTPVVFYFSVIFFTNPNFKFKFSDLKYGILPVVFFINLLLYHFLDFNKIFGFVFIGLILIQAFLYAVLSYLMIRKHQKRIQMFSSNIEGINLNWMGYIIISIFFINIGYIIFNAFHDSTSIDFILNIIFLMIVYFVGCYCLRQKEIYPIEEKQREEFIFINEDEEEIKRKLISDEELSKIKTQLHHLMETQKPYLDSELNLIKLAELLSVSTHHLSYVINNGFQKNFFQYVNEYRIDHSKNLLKDDRNNHLSILGIAYESGFNSKTSFNTTFKKLTNQTPSEFKK